jgi:hypothetical protein
MAAYYKVEVSLGTNAVEVGIPSPQTVNVVLPLVGPQGPAGPQGEQGPPGEVSGSIDYANVTNKPAAFPPESHTHVAADVTDFATAVAAAAPPTTDASLLTSGTLSDARLSSAVTASLGKADSASQPGHTHTLSDITDAGTAAASNTGDFATSAQGSLADTAVQPGDLATVATTGDYDDLTDKPTIPTASTATPSALGVAAAGTSADFARADHVHALPSADDLNLGVTDSVEFAAIRTQSLRLDDATSGFAAEIDASAGLSDDRTYSVPDASGTLALTADFAAPPAIGSTTPNSGAFTTLTANNGTLTASAPVLDLAQTWNNSGTTFTGLKVTATDTASAAASVIADFSLGSTSVFAVTKNGIRLRKGVDGTINTFLETSSGDAGGDLFIRSSAGGNTFRFIAYQNDCYCDNSAAGRWVFRNSATTTRFAITAAGGIQLNNNQVELIPDGTDTLAQRRTTNPQTFRLYNTVSGTANVNFERANFRWASNEFIIDAEAGGTGTLRGIKIGSATSSLLGFYGVTPVDQPATVADPAGGGTIDTEARTAINDLIDRLQELGLIA